ncbi:hypothetical protein [Spirillospora albida]|uniref:hypothetical protein n=1 Tax=Spirillospora albida TaxID=58123 RepID=UPI0004C1FF64|nr:hypothetical protein [Spirillospora albida]
MRFEPGFIACYTLVLIGGAAGLHRLGKVDTSPWRSRALAGYRRAVPDPPDPGPPAWPHTESGRLHTLMALVVAVAAVTLPLAELLRYHRPVEVAVLGTVALAAAAMVLRLTTALRR